MDFDGKRRSDNPLLTAGPYEADPKFLPGSRPAAVPQSRTISFDYAKPLPKELAALSDAMAKELPLGKLPDGKTGFLLKDVPVMNANPPTAAVLNKNMHSLRIGRSRGTQRRCTSRLGLVEPWQGRAVALPHHPPGRHGRGTEMGGRQEHRPLPGQVGRQAHRRRQGGHNRHRLAVQGRPGEEYSWPPGTTTTSGIP